MTFYFYRPSGERGKKVDTGSGIPVDVSYGYSADVSSGYLTDVIDDSSRKLDVECHANVLYTRSKNISNGTSNGRSAGVPLQFRMYTSLYFKKKSLKNGKRKGEGGKGGRGKGEGEKVNEEIEMKGKDEIMAGEIIKVKENE